MSSCFQNTCTQDLSPPPVSITKQSTQISFILVLKLVTFITVLRLIPLIYVNICEVNLQELLFTRGAGHGTEPRLRSTLGEGAGSGTNKGSASSSSVLHVHKVVILEAGGGLSSFSVFAIDLMQVNIATFNVIGSIYNYSFILTGDLVLKPYDLQLKVSVQST